MERFGQPAQTALPVGILGRYDVPARTTILPQDEVRRPRTAVQKPGQSQHDALMNQAQKWVSQTFFGTLLKQMRDSPFKSQVFSGGRGGQVFSEMQDQRLAEHMAHASGRKLAVSIAKHIERSRNNPATRKKAPDPRGFLDTDGPEEIPGTEMRSHVPSAR
jgi:Rod binding domain-containing protein